MFMNLLGKVLKRLVQTDGKNQIMKIIGEKKKMNFISLVIRLQTENEYKFSILNQINFSPGRILTKFGESKLFALTEVGIHNLLTLFLVMASIIGTEESVKKIIQFEFEQIPNSHSIYFILQRCNDCTHFYSN